MTTVRKNRAKGWGTHGQDGLGGTTGEDARSSTLRNGGEHWGIQPVLNIPRQNREKGWATPLFPRVHGRGRGGTTGEDARSSTLRNGGEHWGIQQVLNIPSLRQNRAKGWATIPTGARARAQLHMNRRLIGRHYGRGRP